MEHAAQDISPLDRTVPRCASQRHGTLLINALVGPRMVIVVDVGRQHPVQMALAEDQDLPNTLPHFPHLVRNQ